MQAKRITETQIRQLERIEEGFLRKLFQTSTGCSLAQLYLESGHIPARFAIQKARLLFLKSILEEKPESVIQRFFNLQLKNPTKGDWASSCQQDLKELEINLSMQEIKSITKSKFTKIIKKAIQVKALEYLLRKQGSKGKEMKYEELKLAEYLSPCENRITITDQRNIFAIRNRMVPIESNFGNKNAEMCVCGKNETMKHIYYCEYWNENEELNIRIPYEEIFKNNISKQVEISRRFFRNFEKRCKFRTQTKKSINLKQNEPHVIQFCDPLFLSNGDGNG